MEKIPTIFDRDWDGHRGVIDSPVVSPALLSTCLATEKLDGANVRLTVRAHQLMRLEKRRNPSREEKQRGITEPWYSDANPRDGADRYLWEAANGTDLSDVPDGEWSGEAVGPKIQGNPLRLAAHTVYLFSLPLVRNRLALFEVPLEYHDLRAWLATRLSTVGENVPIEGVVWHDPNKGPVGKIKAKDFKS